MRDFKLRRRFNKLVKDGGAGGGGLVVREIHTSTDDGDTYTLSETYKTIREAMESAKTVVIINERGIIFPVVSCGKGEIYRVEGLENIYGAETEDDFPSYTESSGGR